MPEPRLLHRRIAGRKRSWGPRDRAATKRTVAFMNSENTMRSRARPPPLPQVLLGGDYRLRARDALVTVLDIEMRHGRATGRLLAVETTGAVRLPFVCREEDLILAPTRTAVGEGSAPAAGTPRRGRRSP